VNAVLPSSLPDQVRSDVAQDMMLAVLAGEIRENDLAKSVRRYIKKHHQAYDNRFNTVSLDQPMPGTETRRWAETIPSDHDVWR
jgi:hypothetical protein